MRRHTLQRGLFLAGSRSFAYSADFEVSDTTLDFDTKTKARLYARAGIADYWVLDITGRRIIVHRSLEGGAYRSLTV